MPIIILLYRSDKKKKKKESFQLQTLRSRYTNLFFAAKSTNHAKLKLKTTNKREARNFKKKEISVK